jgi:uncharacterized protein
MKIMYELPLFPLNTVLFPGMPLRLHIFEERYKVMLQEVMKSNQTFGVNLIKSGVESMGPLALPHDIGCTARVLQVEPLADGRMNITVVGDERFQVLRLGNADPYLMAFVESKPLESHHSLDVIKSTKNLRPRIIRYLSLLSDHLEVEVENEEADPNLNLNLTELQLPEDPMMLIYLAASLLQVPSEEKQPLLEAETAAALLEKVQRLYRRELAVLPPLLEVSEEQAQVSAWVN